MTSAPRHSRREILRIGGASIAAIPLATLLAACGGDDQSDEQSAGTESGAPASVKMGTWSIASRWIPTELVPGEQRLPVSLADADKGADATGAIAAEYRRAWVKAPQF